MTEPPSFRIDTSAGTVWVARRDDLDGIEAWRHGLERTRKDRRYYEIVEDTLGDEYEHGYFVLERPGEGVRAVQPFFLVDQDLLAGAGSAAAGSGFLRRLLAPLLHVRTLMVGCVAGEGHLDHDADEDVAWVAGCLHEALPAYAKAAKARLIVLKEFPAAYREPLSCFSSNGYTRAPSFPMTRLSIAYDSFDDYLTTALSRATRKNLRRKLRAAEAADPIAMEVRANVEEIVDELYPLYLNVYERSTFRFEKLTPEYFRRLGREMPDRVRFFVWRQNGRAIAFSLCMIQDDAIYDEYIGLDYSVALDLHLYFRTLRDVVEWAIANGYRWYCSNALNYQPKRHLRCELVPLDLYVAHTSPLANRLLRRILPLLEPTHRDAALRSFPDYAALRGALDPTSAGQSAASEATLTARADSGSGGSSLG